MRHKCSIEGCERLSRARSWCDMHYQRWKHQGDPLGKGVSKWGTRHGEILDYLERVILAYDGDACLPWPYAKNKKGYGQIHIDGRQRDVHRVVCERAHGQAPTPRHHAAHGCGHGHLACCTKRHLGWKTPLQNSADKIIHGTLLFGESLPVSKLTNRDVRQIRALKGTATQREIGANFGVSDVTVSLIYRGKIWSHVTGIDT